jgi:hypothetical protein
MNFTKFIYLPFTNLKLEILYFRKTEVMMTVIVALAINVKASCTTHWVAC